MIIIPNKFVIFTIFRYFHQYFPIFFTNPNGVPVRRGPYQEDQEEARAFVLERWGPWQSFRIDENWKRIYHGIYHGIFRVSNKPWVLSCQISIQVSDMKFLFVCFTTIHFRKCYTFELQQEFGPKAIRWVCLQSLKGLPTIEFA